MRTFIDTKLGSMKTLWVFVMAMLGCEVDALAPPLGFNLESLLGERSGLGSPRSLEFKYTHLEVNGMLWEVPAVDLSLVVDPIASQLDFGIPWGYRANKKVLTEIQTLDMIEKAKPDYLLLSQGLDDHTHLPTLTKLVERLPNMEFIVAPSAKEKIACIVPDSQVTVLNPGGTVSIGKGKSAQATVTATEGALVGPPWQARENGWLLTVNKSTKPATAESPDLSVYFEPHADVILDKLSGLKADIAISPVREQSLPTQVPKEGQFTLVYGGQRTLEIAEHLGASVVVPLGNGELTTEGPLAALVKETGTVEEFEELVKRRNLEVEPGLEIRVECPVSGVPLRVRV